MERTAPPDSCQQLFLIIAAVGVSILSFLITNSGVKDMAVIMVPSSLRRYTGQQSKISLPVATIEEALDRFSEFSSELRNHLFSGKALRNFVVVCKNGKDIRLLDGLATPVDNDDEVQIIASVAGG